MSQIKVYRDVEGRRNIALMSSDEGYYFRQTTETNRIGIETPTFGAHYIFGPSMSAVSYYKTLKTAQKHAERFGWKEV